MKMYVDENQRFEDTKSTALSFTLVGIIGLVLIVLMWFDIFPISIPNVTRIMMSVVMGALFLIFLIVGIKSFLSLKTIKSKALAQENDQDNAIEWFISEFEDQMLVQFDVSKEDDEEIYFQRYDFIFNTIKEKYDSFSEEVIDHISEEIYNTIYTNNK